MLEWINQNSAFVSASTSLITVLIWAAYLQIFYFAYRRQRRPMILINRARGLGRDSHCLISNMSAESIYVLCILAVLDKGDDTLVCAVTDDEDVAESSPQQPRTHQGPLRGGDFMDAGSFEDMLARATTVESSRSGDVFQDPPASFDAIEIRVIAIYASSKTIIGASRRFERMEEGKFLRPVRLETKQLAGYSARKNMKSLLREHL